MIRLDTPALCLNSVDVPGPHYRCSRTIDMPRGTLPNQLATYILEAYSAFSATDGGLSNIVINCHGEEGGGALLIGGRGSPKMFREHVVQLSGLAKIQTGPIWLVACQAARGSMGQALCSSIATTAKKLVIAADEDQVVGPWESYRYHLSPHHNMIDDFEGTVYAFYADGSIVRDITLSDVPSVVGR